jgi:prophage regulatory protein
MTIVEHSKNLIRGDHDVGRRLLREGQTREKLGRIGVTKFAELRKDPDFPRAVLISPRCLAWDEAELDAWIDSRQRVQTLGGVTPRVTRSRREAAA